jgi:hypothetical protein
MGKTKNGGGEMNHKDTKNTKTRLKQEFAEVTERG